MSTNLRYYTAAVYELDHAIRRVPADAWDNPSPCDGWTARDVAGHAMGVVAMVAARLGAGPMVDPFGDLAAIATDDPAAAFGPIKARTLAALDTQGTLATVVQSSAGDTTVDAFIGRLAQDALIHAWDIARAAGIDDTLDPALVAETLDRMKPDEMPRGPDRYGAIVEVADDAGPQDRMLAIAGRDPRP